MAQLAGIPRAVINQANHQLDIMEKNAVDLLPDTPPQRDLFQQPDEIRKLLKEVEPDSVTPKQALETLIPVDRTGAELTWMYSMNRVCPQVILIRRNKLQLRFIVL